MLLVLPLATDGGCALGGGPLLGLAEAAPSALRRGSDDSSVGGVTAGPTELHSD